MIAGEGATYDPRARRDTPLSLKLKQRIRAHGPITVADYMTSCLLDPEHGFYWTSAPFGRSGHFVTAPEISQVFGELLGLWAAVAWQQMGRPSTVQLIELGPGRGTMMRDMLRAARIVPDFACACRVTLVEAGPGPRALQRETLAGAGAPIAWAETAHDIADGPAIVIANEFVDALAVVQDVKTAEGWAERVVAVDGDGRLEFATGARVARPGGFGQPEPGPGVGEGAILEWQPHDALWLQFAKRAAAHPVAGLIIDYGHTRSATGETLQAIRDHAYEHPLTSPGEADLSVQVDFERLAISARHAGLAIDGPVPQAELLGRLGIVERASRLMAANAERAADIEAGVARLMTPNGMGTRFQAIGLRSPSLPPLPGLEG